jgi:hypothetical protein
VDLVREVRPRVGSRVGGHFQRRVKLVRVPTWKKEDEALLPSWLHFEVT